MESHEEQAHERSERKDQSSQNVGFGASQGFLTNRDSSSIFTISNDSNVEEQKKRRSRKASKTQRQAHGGLRGNNQLAQKVVEIQEGREKKPLSSRSNNLELWLSKKRALQKKSDNLTEVVQGLTPAKAEVEFISEESKDAEDKKSVTSKGNDISYLSKLQCSLVFEPAEREQSQMIEKEDVRELQKSQPQPTKPKPRPPCSPKEEKGKKGEEKKEEVRRSSNLVASNEYTESLLVFNPREEAILDLYQGGLSLSQNKFLKETVEGMRKENVSLREQVEEQANLIQIHKKMIEELIKQQTEELQAVKESSKDLVKRLEEQARFLEGKGMFENSQISFLTTTVEIEVDIDKQRKKVPCRECAGYVEQVMVEQKKTEGQLTAKIQLLQEDLAQATKLDSQRANMCRSKEEGSPINSEAARRLASSTSEDGERKMENFEKALLPIVEKISDPNEVIFFQDQRKRVFKIVMCEEEEEEPDQDVLREFVEEHKLEDFPLSLRESKKMGTEGGSARESMEPQRKGWQSTTEHGSTQGSRVLDNRKTGPQEVQQLQTDFQSNSNEEGKEESRGEEIARYFLEEGKESQVGDELNEEEEDDLEDFDAIANEL